MGRISFIRPVETGDCFERNDFIVLEWTFLAAKRNRCPAKESFVGHPLIYSLIIRKLSLRLYESAQRICAP